VSCTSPSFCMAVGDSKPPPVSYYAVTWNGSTWSKPTNMEPKHDYQANIETIVSCVSSSFCEASGGEGNLLTWDGSRWSAAKGGTLSDPFPLFTYVSCTSRSFCMAVRTEEDAYYVLRWNGASWSPPGRLRSPYGQLLAVSCPTVSFCMTTGFYQDPDDEASYAIWDGRTWTAPVQLAHTLIDALSSVSCVSRTFCMAVGYSSAQRWDGKSWTAPQSIDANFSLSWVSCPIASFCMAVDQEGHFLKWST